MHHGKPSYLYACQSPRTCLLALIALASIIAIAKGGHSDAELSAGALHHRYTGSAAAHGENDYDHESMNKFPDPHWRAQGCSKDFAPKANFGASMHTCHNVEEDILGLGHLASACNTRKIIIDHNFAHHDIDGLISDILSLCDLELHERVRAAVNARLQILTVSNCPVTGNLPELPYPNPDPSIYDYRRIWGLNSGLFTGTIPSSWLNYTWNQLDISFNFGINGTRPAKMFGAARPDSGASSVTTSLGALIIGNTSLSGKMALDPSQYFPNFFHNPPNSLNLFFNNMPYMDFCSEESPTWNISTFQCYLLSTNATQCPEKYAGAGCFVSPPTSPSPAPYSAVVPSSSNACPPPRPSPAFTCLNGTCFSPTSVTAPSLTIPRGSIVKINGSLTSPSVVFHGLGSIFTISGCVNGLKQVSIELTQGDVEKLEKAGTLKQTLIQSATDGNTDSPSLSNVGVSIPKSTFGCKRVVVTTENSSSSKTNLTVLFKLDKSKCNLWWIILVSVICALVIIAVIILTIAIKVWRTKKFSSAKLRH